MRIKQKTYYLSKGDNIIIPTEKHLDKIVIGCNETMNDATLIHNIVKSIKTLHPESEICVNTHIIDGIECILPDVDCLTLRLYDENDFSKFLDMDNHLTSADTKGKELVLTVKDAVKIDDMSPEELPLIWSIQKSLT